MATNNNAKAVAKLLQDKYMTYPDIFGVNVINCKGCGGEYVEVYMNTHNRQLMSFIPSNLNGIRIEKIHQSKPLYEQENFYVPYYTYPYLYTSIYGMPSYRVPMHRPRFTHRQPRIGGGFRRR